VSRWTRDRWLAAGLVAVGGALVLWVYRLPHEARANAVGFGGFVLAMVGVLITVLPQLSSGRRRAGPRPVPTLATLLAHAVAEWEEVKPQRFRMASLRAALSPQALAKALAVGLMAGFGVWLAAGLTGGLVGDDAEQASPLGPRETWRNDCMAGLVVGFTGRLTSKFTTLLVGMFTGGLAGMIAGMIAVGFAGIITGGLAVGLASAFRVGIAFGVTVGLAVALTGVVAVGVAGTATWTTRLAWRQLRMSGRVPAVGLMPFLDDARERGVLRTVGPFYQFRHATLQDQLAGQPLSSGDDSCALRE
jgi:MFS family permease